MVFTTTLYDQEKIQQAAEVLKAVGHPLRLRIIKYLDTYNELSVGQLQELLKIGQSAVSQQLSLLRNKGIVRNRREGTTVFYALDNKQVVKLIQCFTNNA